MYGSYTGSSLFTFYIGTYQLLGTGTLDLSTCMINVHVCTIYDVIHAYDIDIMIIWRPVFVSKIYE